MNAFRPFPAIPAKSTSAPSAAAQANAPAIRHEHRERDFGVGYGNSSGYASPRHYASNWAPPRFKCA